ncbi:A/G-specific adenine glycosylase [Parvularcula flava]|uniref:Adenine DNA glycosylase n=1 Tax=Aquisalinus luteolus TaxID=1566827 RepID=A0A8J3A878_9PROT|nr:A/G-specific adenine glycosylase [Aquisalinus luteolus]GGH99350.1 A/G-specific adenine glycosylase [Aquisalinus luteolus]
MIDAALLDWYDRHARVLPWRTGPAARKRGERPDPYRVWLSEVMLQQTTVATVTPRYARFLELFPTVEALAAAPVEDVLAEWAGLGYYARARNLHKCAQVVAGEHGGVFPQTEEGLLALPGIGAYTAAAIAAIAFDEPAVVMDGNIERVMARLFAVETPLPDAKPVLRDHAASLTPDKRPGDYAQALMDLGATICTPRNPACALCPLREKCIAQKNAIQADLPRKKKKAAKPTRFGTAFHITRKGDGAVLLVRRPDKGLLGGMLAFPATEWGERADAEPPIKAAWLKADEPVRHTFTHFHLEMDVWMVTVSDAAARKAQKALQGEWHPDPAMAGLPTVFRKVLDVTNRDK